MKEYRILIGEGNMFAFGNPITSCGVIYIGFITEDETMQKMVMFSGDTLFVSKAI